MPLHARREGRADDPLANGGGLDSGGGEESGGGADGDGGGGGGGGAGGDGGPGNGSTHSISGSVCLAPAGAVTVQPNLWSGATEGDPRCNTTAPKSSRSTVRALEHETI